MDLSKIKALIDCIGQSNVSELTVTEKGVTVRIFSQASVRRCPLESCIGRGSRRCLNESRR